MAPPATSGAPQGDNKRWLLYAFDMSCAGHQSPGLWVAKGDKSSNFDTLGYWTDLAQLLERGKFDGLFLADVLGGYDVYGANLDAALRSGAQFPVTDPTLAVSAMAHVTSNLSFGVTATTSFEHPYALARRFSTLDHLTNGRVGWNVVTGYLDSAARNFGSESQELHAKRYEVAHEYLDVVFKLWEGSWADDAVALDEEKKIYTRPERVRKIDHRGEHYPHVPGPHIVHPSAQRTPLIFQAGSSGPGLAFAGKHAEAIFIAAPKAALAKKRVDAARQAAEDAGRARDSIKVLALLTVIVADTDEEAQELHRKWTKQGSAEGALALFGGWTGIDLSPYGDDEELNPPESKGNAVQSAVENFARSAPEVGRWTKQAVADQLTVGGLGPVVAGSVQTVADELEKWVTEGGVDGFNFAYALTPGTQLGLVEKLVPELQRRGHVWDDYPTPAPKTDAQIKRKHTGEPGFGEGTTIGLTAREHLYGVGQPRLRDDHWASALTWRKDQPAPPLIGQASTSADAKKRPGAAQETTTPGLKKVKA